MILADTGFLVGAISEDDQYHRRCIEISATIPPRYITTWSCVTEAMHLLGIPPAQEKLRLQIEAGILLLYETTSADALRACSLMRRYRPPAPNYGGEMPVFMRQGAPKGHGGLMRRYIDAPMDFADASLVVSAEVLNITRILTFDRHFHAYRINDTTPFEVVS